MADTVVMSKSAKKRAAKTARDQAYAEQNPEAPAKAVEKEPAPKAAAKKAAGQAAPPKAEVKAQSKPAAKKKATSESAPAKQQQPAPKDADGPPQFTDDGTGGDWATATSGPKGKEDRQKRRKEREEQAKKEEQQRELDKQKALMETRKTQSKGDSKAQEAIRKAEEALRKVAEGKTDRAAALAAVKEAMEKQPDGKAETTATPAGATGSFTCDDAAKIGRLIGKAGINLIKIKEKTGVDRIDTEDKTFTCVGEADAVAKAIAALKELHDKGYTAIAYESFSEVTVMAPTSCFPDIIGKQGSIIKVMKEALGVEITMPPASKNDKGKHPIKIAGEKDKAAECQEVIQSIIMYYHHELTHPHLVHEEMDIPGWAYSFIIGRGGSEMKHIQKNWDVKVYIPRETSENQNVVIVGMAKDVERAKKYVTSLVEKDRSTGREKAGKADDYWGEDQVDPDLEQYMYKRK